MPDNVTLPGASQVIASDDISGAQYQRVKPAWGVDGSAVDASLTNPIPVQMQTIAPTPTTGNITGNGQTVTATLNGANSILAVMSGTFSTVNVTFEATVDGTNWFAPHGGRLDAFTIGNTTGNKSSTVEGYLFRVSGCTQFRVRSTAYTSGTQAWTLAPSYSDFAPLGTVGTVGINGTVTTSISGNPVLGAGTNLLGDVSPGIRTTSTNAELVRNVVSTADTNQVNFKSSAGRLYGWTIGNNSGSWRYLKFHNTSGTPTAGSGVVNTVAIPPGGIAQLHLTAGQSFATGLSYTIVAGAATSDTTGIGANEVIGSIYYG
jgi:hypothetical protein